MPAAVNYLESLNPAQRRAVEHGVVPGPDGRPASPLLVIAGAGSGKTNTLAHRVAHLIVNGADPRRILLMTFSRRAAAEMSKRVARIARQVLGDKAGIMTTRCNGPAPSTASARGCCATIRIKSGWIPPSPSMIATIPPT